MPFKRSQRLRHKYNAVPTTVEGIKFASKREAAYYAELRALQASGTVIQFLRQVSFHLPGGTRYVCDFLVFYADGSCSFIDVKGFETPAFRKAKKQVEDLYRPISMEVVK